MTIEMHRPELTPVLSRKAPWQSPELTVLAILSTATGAAAINENDSADNIAS